MQTNVGPGWDYLPAWPGCSHCYCGGGWMVRGSTTGGDPGGTISWATCCKCGAASEPAYSWALVGSPNRGSAS